MNPSASGNSGSISRMDITASTTESINTDSTSNTATTAPSNTESNNDHLLPQSQLGTKEYWEAIYERDLDNYGDHGDEGEIW